MSPNLAQPRRGWTDHLHQDRIVVFGGSDRTLDLLMLAVIRSDCVILVTGEQNDAIRRFAQRFAVEHRQTRAEGDIASAATVLVALDNVNTASHLAREARAAGKPIHVAGQPLLSDFNMLEFLERRSSSLSREPS